MADPRIHSSNLFEHRHISRDLVEALNHQAAIIAHKVGFRNVIPNQSWHIIACHPAISIQSRWPDGKQ